MFAFGESFQLFWQPRLLSVLRIVAGLMFMQHGLSKYFGFPMPAPNGFEMMTLLGVGGGIEAIGGALIALGLFTRLAAFVCSGQMAVAYWLFHGPKGFFPQANGGELAIFYCFTFLYLSVAGGGLWGIDGARARG